MRLFRRDGTRFMILGVAVDLPQIVKLRVCQDVFATKHRRHHGVVLIVILVHAVAPHQMQVRKPIFQLLSDRIDVRRVVVVVNWISFLLPHDAAVQNVTCFRQPNLHEFARGQLNQVFIA